MSPALTFTVRGVLPSLSSVTPVIENVSSPEMPRDSALSPSGYCSGSTPIPIRFDRWIRSSSSAMTALTPSSAVPLAAQVARRAGAVLLAGQDDQRRSGLEVLLGRLEDSGHVAAREVAGGPRPLRAGRQLDCAAGCWRRCRGLITSWLPRREP